MTQNTADTLSKISIALSSLCIIHCLSFPLLILALPAVSHLFSDTVESAVLLSVVPLSALGFFPTWRKHKNYRFLSVYIGSLTVMLLAHFSLTHVHITHHTEAASFDFLVSTSLSVLAAISLAWVIYRNKRHTHVCANPHHHHC